jgi:hypothetical protein
MPDLEAKVRALAARHRVEAARHRTAGQAIAKVHEPVPDTGGGGGPPPTPDGSGTPPPPPSPVLTGPAAAEALAAVTEIFPGSEVVEALLRQPGDAWGPTGTERPGGAPRPADQGAEPTPAPGHEPEPDPTQIAFVRARLAAPVARFDYPGLDWTDPAVILEMARRLARAEQRLQEALDEHCPQSRPLSRDDGVRFLASRDRPPGERLTRAEAKALIYARAGRAWRDEGGVLWPIGSSPGVMSPAGPA